MTSIIIINHARCHFGYVERADPWFWKTCQRFTQNSRLNDNQLPTIDDQLRIQQLSLFATL